MVIPLLALFLAPIPAAAPSPPAKDTRVAIYLDLAQAPTLSKRCLNLVAQGFGSEIDKVKNVEAARYRSKADVVATVEECVVAEGTPVEGVVGVSRDGSDTGSTTTVSASGRTTGQRTMGRVVLSVDVDGKPREFGSGPDALPFDEAVRLATKSLLDWIQAGRHP
jgi:hypothetical protein